MSRANLGTIDPDTTGGTALATNLTAFEQALLTQHSDGTGTRPTYAVAKTIWVNDSVTPWIVNMYDGTDDIAIGTIDIAGNKFIPGSSAAAVFADIKQAASTTATGAVELATQAEVNAGTGTNLAVTSTTLNTGVLGLTLKNYKETVDTNATATGAVTLNMNNGNVHNLTLTGNVTLTFSNAATAGLRSELMINLVQDATGSRIVTWPAAVKWAGGTAPTLTTTAAATDIMTLFTIDAGTTWFGSVIGLNLS